MVVLGTLDAGFIYCSPRLLRFDFFFSHFLSLYLLQPFTIRLNALESELRRSARIVQYRVKFRSRTC